MLCALGCNVTLCCFTLLYVVLYCNVLRYVRLCNICVHQGYGFKIYENMICEVDCKVKLLYIDCNFVSLYIQTNIQDKLKWSDFERTTQLGSKLHLNLPSEVSGTQHHQSSFTFVYFARNLPVFYPYVKCSLPGVYPESTTSFPGVYQEFTTM